MRSRAFVILADQIVVSVGSFASTAVLARHMEQEVFGLYALWWISHLVLVTIQSALVIFPMQTEHQRIREADRLPYLDGSWLLGVASALVLSLLLASVLGLARPSEMARSELYSAVFLASFSGLVQETMRRRLIIDGAIVRALLSDLISVGLRIGVILFVGNRGNISAADVFTITGIVTAVSLMPSGVERIWPINRMSGTLSLALKNNFPASRWLLPSGLMQWTSINLFVLMASVLLEPAAVAGIRATQNLVAVLNIFSLALDNILPAKFTRLYMASGWLSVMSVYWQVVAAGMIVGSFLVFFSWLLGGDLLAVVYGHAFSPYSELLVIFAAAQVSSFMIIPVRAAIRATEKNKHWFVVYLVVTVLSVAAVIPVVQEFGALGVAWATLAAGVLVASLGTAVLVCAKREEIRNG